LRFGGGIETEDMVAGYVGGIQSASIVAERQTVRKHAVKRGGRLRNGINLGDAAAGAAAGDEQVAGKGVSDQGRGAENIHDGLVQCAIGVDLHHP